MLELRRVGTSCNVNNERTDYYGSSELIVHRKDRIRVWGDVKKVDFSLSFLPCQTTPSFPFQRKGYPVPSCYLWSMVQFQSDGDPSGPSSLCPCLSSVFGSWIILDLGKTSVSGYEFRFQDGEPSSRTTPIHRSFHV